MDTENAVADPSIGDLRAMLGGNAPAAEAPAGEKETPAPDASASGESAPASEPDEAAGKPEQQPRGEDGKFKAGEPAVKEDDPPGVKKRIGKALEETRKAKERVRELEQQLEQANSGSQPAPKPAQPAAAADLTEPNEKDFDSYKDYTKALIDYNLKKQRADDAKAASERSAAERESAALNAWNERVTKTAEIHADYEDVMAEAGEIPISKAMHDTIFHMERGPEVAYFLAKNPAEAERIAKLDGLSAAAELGAIRASLTKPAAAPPRAQGKPLPKPAAAVGGGAAPHVVDLNDPTLPMDKFKSEFKKRLKRAA